MEIATTTAQASAATTSTPVISSDFETFLKMLTAQMQNQDPLNPIESSDYATQLATFSSVEQQVLTNDLLVGLQAEISAMGLSQLSSWIGMEARTNAAAYFDGDPIDFVPQQIIGADTAEVVITDETGAEIARYDIDLATESGTWDGLDSAGNTVPHGLYSIAVESFELDQSLGQLPAEVYATITEARNDVDGIFLMLQGGAITTPAQITGLRQP